MKVKFLDTIAHLLLFLGIVVAALAFWGLRSQVGVQLLVVFLAVTFYIFWAIVYHSARRDLSKKLFLEYLLVAAIACVVGILVFYT